MKYLQYLLSLIALLDTISALQLNQAPQDRNVTKLTSSPGAFSTSLNVTAIANTMQYIFPALSRLLLFHKEFNTSLKLDIPPSYRFDIDKVTVESVSGPKHTTIE